MSKRAVYILSRSALDLGQKLGRELDAAVYAPHRFATEGCLGFASLPEQVAVNFTHYAEHIFIAATGIVVRSIAPLLRDKAVDPAVVSMDPAGRFVISLLSGHLGGANALAQQCAALTGGQAVITTATDCAGLPSLDMLAQKQGLRIGDLGAIKHVNAALLEGRPVQVYDPYAFLGPLDSAIFSSLPDAGEWQPGLPGVWVHWEERPPQEAMVRLYPPVLAVGVGCRRGVPEHTIHAFLCKVLREHGLSTLSIAALGSADIKRNEAGLLQTAQELQAPVEFFTPEQLKAVAAPNPSAMVESHVGTPGVCEAAALLLAAGGELLVPKQKTDCVTIAVARRTLCLQP